MAKSIEQMSIAELQQEIARREQMLKKVPLLEQEKEKLTQRLAEIDDELEMMGASPKKAGRKPGRSAGRPAGRASKMKRGSGGRLPRGAMQKAILDALGAETISPAEIAQRISDTSIPGMTGKNVSMALNNMRKNKQVALVARGMYKAI